MAANKTLLILPGDGIGVEVMAQVRRIVDWFDRRRAIGFDILEQPVGGAAYDAHGTPLSDEALAEAMDADAVLLGAVGGPQYDNVPRDMRPEAGLLKLRKEMDLFANLRPALVFDALVDASTLKREIVEGLDILILRELTAGVYFGEPRAISANPGASRFWPTARAAPSTPRPIPKMRSDALPKSRSTWRASAATRSIPWKRQMSWNPAFSGARP
jgi:3-isopropylmalate dehydrogenase